MTLSPPLPDDDAPFDALLRRALRAELDQIPLPASGWAALQARLAAPARVRRFPPMDRISALLRYSLWTVTDGAADPYREFPAPGEPRDAWQKATFTLPRGLDVATWRTLIHRRPEATQPREPLT